jgi:hypothetical protein
LAVEFEYEIAGGVGKFDVRGEPSGNDQLYAVIALLQLSKFAVGKITVFPQELLIGSTVTTGVLPTVKTSLSEVDPQTFEEVKVTE